MSFLFKAFIMKPEYVGHSKVMFQKGRTLVGKHYADSSFYPEDKLYKKVIQSDQNGINHQDFGECFINLKGGLS